MILASKLIAATAVFVLLLMLIEVARGKVALAAGMMLTFPAINGITLFFANSPTAGEQTATMLPMIAFNGLMCLGFVMTVTSLLRRYPANSRSIVGVSLAAAFFAWVLMAWQHLQFSSLRSQFYLVCGYLMLALIPIALSSAPATAAATGDTWQHALSKLWRNPRLYGRIILFVATLWLVLIAPEEFVGALGAAPLVPLFGLWVISESGEASIDALAAVCTTVLLGPVIAMTFVMSFGRAIDHAGPFSGFLSLILGWGICALAIFFLSNTIVPHFRGFLRARRR